VTETKEWKEKGVGEMKILKHRQTGAHRILMRHDQVLKLCANHRITPELKLESMNEKQLRWMAQDCSDNEVRTEILGVNFLSEDQAKRFREEFEKAQKAVPTGKVAETKPAAPRSSLKPLSEMFKSETNAWKCNQCLVSNKDNTESCVACGSPKIGPVIGGVQNLAQSMAPATLPAFGGLSMGTNKENGTNFSFGLPAAGKTDVSVSYSASNVFQRPIVYSSPSTPQVTTTTSTMTKTVTEAPKTEAMTPSSALQAPLFEQPTGGLFGQPTGGLFGQPTGGLFGQLTGGLFGKPGAAPTPLFACQIPKAVESEEDTEEAGNPEEYEPNVSFQPIAPKSALKPLSEIFRTNEWKCTACYVPNKPDNTKCVCCGTLKPDVKAPEASYLQFPGEAPKATPAFSFGGAYLSAHRANAFARQFESSFGSTTTGLPGTATATQKEDAKDALKPGDV